MIEENSVFSFQKSLLSGSSSTELTLSDFLNRIEKKDSHINSFVNVFSEEALKRSKWIDEKINSGQKLGKLFGLVTSIKDNICIKGHPSSAGSKALCNFKSIYSATVIDRLINEDAIILGTTNCDEFGMGSSNENSVYGPVLNPVNLSKVAGGSSGGAAASVAAGFCHLALGSDTGGSVRQPAAFCGVVGFKPSYGKVSRYGLMAYASSFDQIGIIGNSIPDIRKVLSVIEGPDEFDSTTVSRQGSSSDLKKPLKVAVLRSESESRIVKAAIGNLKEALDLKDTQFENLSFKYLDYLIPVYYIIAMAEASSNLSRYDGAHFGYRSEDIDDFDELYLKSRSEGFGKEVIRRIMTGTFILSEGYFDAYYKKAQRVRSLILNEINTVFSEYDFIVTPVSNSVAPDLGAEMDPIDVYQSDIYTVLANICGIPALTLPIFKVSGMPFGIQIHARQFDDEKLLEFSEQIMHNHKFPIDLS